MELWNIREIRRVGRGFILEDVTCRWRSAVLVNHMLHSFSTHPSPGDHSAPRIRNTIHVLIFANYIYRLPTRFIYFFSPSFYHITRSLFDNLFLYGNWPYNIGKQIIRIALNGEIEEVQFNYVNKMLPNPQSQNAKIDSEWILLAPKVAFHAQLS